MAVVARNKQITVPWLSSACADYINEKDRVLDKDLDAYKRLRQDGVQPRKIDGSANVEKRAEEKWQVETGILPNV